MDPRQMQRRFGNTGSYFNQMANHKASYSHADRRNWLVQLLSWLPFVTFVKTEKPLSADDHWKLIRTQNKLMFQFYLLIFLFYNDDMVLDNYEKRMVDKQFRKAKSVLTKDHYQTISDMGSSFVSLNDIEAYIADKKLTNDFVSESINEIKSMVYKLKKYHSLLDDVVVQLLDK